MSDAPAADAKEKPKSKKMLIIIIAAAIFFGLGSVISRIWTNYLWFAEVGQTDVFWTPFVARLCVGLVFGVIFLGIFITMVPALELLRLRGGEIGITQPWQFFWASGGFSSFLDNAPTYLTFAALGQGLGLGGPFLGMPEKFLLAISAGAVFFGANTYIGNAPNFMVRSIAEHSEWKMPSFFGYMLWSGFILLPLFFLITLIFFR